MQTDMIWKGMIHIRSRGCCSWACRGKTGWDCGSTHNKYSLPDNTYQASIVPDHYALIRNGAGFDRQHLLSSNAERDCSIQLGRIFPPHLCYYEYRLFHINDADVDALSQFIWLGDFRPMRVRSNLSALKDLARLCSQGVHICYGPIAYLCE